MCCWSYDVIFIIIVTCFRVGVNCVQARSAFLLVSGSSPRSTALSRSTRQPRLATIALTTTMMMPMVTISGIASCDSVDCVDAEPQFWHLSVVCLFVCLSVLFHRCWEQLGTFASTAIGNMCCTNCPHSTSFNILAFYSIYICNSRYELLSRTKTLLCILPPHQQPPNLLVLLLLWIYWAFSILGTAYKYKYKWEFVQHGLQFSPGALTKCQNAMWNRWAFRSFLNLLVSVVSLMLTRFTKGLKTGLLVVEKM